MEFLEKCPECGVELNTQTAVLREFVRTEKHYELLEGGKTIMRVTFCEPVKIENRSLKCLNCGSIHKVRIVPVTGSFYHGIVLEE